MQKGKIHIIATFNRLKDNKGLQQWQNNESIKACNNIRKHLKALIKY